MIPCKPCSPVIPCKPCSPVIPCEPVIPWIPCEPVIPWIPCVPVIPWEPVIPWIPCVPSVPCIPVIPCIPWIPTSPFCPLSPLLPTVVNDIIISSLFVNGFVVDDDCSSRSNDHHPVLSVKSDIANSINCVASVLFAILIYPFIADVTASIDKRNDWIEVPLSSVISTYPTVEAFCVVLFNLILPVPGSAAAVDVSKV